jgi:hypothetical protein
MTEQELDDYIAAASRALALPIEPQWQNAVRSNLAVTLKLTDLVAQFALPDEAEPAPIFRA